MIVAVIAVRMMQASRAQIVDVIAVGHRLVPAAGRMRVTVGAVDRVGVTVRVSCIHRDHVLVDVIAVRVVKMAVVEIVDVIVVTHGDVTTSFGVVVLMFAFMNCMGHVADRTRRPRGDQAASHGTHSQRAAGPPCIPRR